MLFRSGQLELKYSTDIEWMSSFSEKWRSEARFKAANWNRQAMVDIITLDQLVANYGHPVYTKIDVEGYEPEVIGGLSQKAGMISFEFSREIISNAAAAIARLSEIGYGEFNYSLGENDHWSLAQWLPAGEILDSLSGSCGGDPWCWGDIYAR